MIRTSTMHQSGSACEPYRFRLEVSAQTGATTFPIGVLPGPWLVTIERAARRAQDRALIICSFVAVMPLFSVTGTVPKTAGFSTYLRALHPGDIRNWGIYEVGPCLGVAVRRAAQRVQGPR